MATSDTMGRIKTQKIKRITMDFIKNHKEEFKNTFDENKVVLNGLAEIPSKKMRNTIAGYVTRLMRTKENLV